VERNVDGIIVVDKEGKARFVNPAAKVIFNRKADKFIGQLFGFPLVDSESTEIDIIRPDGKMGIGEMHVSETQWENSPAYLVTVRDITLRKQTEEKIKYLGFHDALTGLYNRTFFEEEIKRLNTQRNYPLSVIMTDINGLKVVNDTLGHDRGDELLKNTAKVLKSVARKEDIVARIGGDEFTVILPHADEHASQSFSNRFKKACEEYNRKTQLKLSVAMGYAIQFG